MTPLPTSSPHLLCAYSVRRLAGPYLPALARLVELICLARPYLAPHAETSVLFLSDGRPSDASCRGANLSELQLPRALSDKMREVHEVCERLTVSLLGFGEADMGLMQKMCAALPPAVASFERPKTAALDAIATSVGSFATSLSVSRISSVSEVTSTISRRDLGHLSASSWRNLCRCPARVTAPSARCVGRTLSAAVTAGR